MKLKEQERKIYEMLKAGRTRDRLEEWEKAHAPEVIIQNEKRKLLKCSPLALQAYDEYQEINKGFFYIKRICIQNEKNLDEWVYQVSYRADEENEYETDNNALFGLLFDTESIAIAYMYRYCKMVHPVFDRYIDE